MQGRALKKAGLGRSGYGLVKIIFLHGEKGNKRPDMPSVTRQDVVALPRLVREYESALEGEHRVWRIPREDGHLLTIATSRQEDSNTSILVSMYIGEAKPALQISRKKPRSASPASVISKAGIPIRGLQFHTGWATTGPVI